MPEPVTSSSSSSPSWSWSWPCSYGLLLASRLSPRPSLGHIFDVPDAQPRPASPPPLAGMARRATPHYTASLVSLSLASLGHSLDARLSQLRCSVASRRFVSTGSLAQLDWERLSLAPPSATPLAKPRQPSTASLYFPPLYNTSTCPRIRSSIRQYTVTSLPTLFRPGGPTRLRRVALPRSDARLALALALLEALSLYQGPTPDALAYATLSSARHPLVHRRSPRALWFGASRVLEANSAKKTSACVGA